MAYAKKNLGLFSPPTFLTTGDPYEKRSEALSRVSGRQFQTQRQRPGQTSDNWGNKKRQYMPLYENNKEQYYQPGQRERQHANDERKKCIQPDGFKYANPTHKQCGTGDYFGAFTKWDYKEPFNPVKTGDPPRPVAEVPPNIKTKPGKKGSYGSNWKTLLGPEYKYSAEPVEKGKATEERLAHEAKMLGRNPFKGHGHPLDFFDTHKHVAASKIYAPSGTPAPLAETAKPEPSDKSPFYPSHVPRSGHYGYLMKFPEYKGDAFMDVQKQQRAEAAAHRAKILVPFKQPSDAKGLPVVPVMTHPRNLHA